MTKSVKIIKAEEKLRELAQYSYKNMCLIHSPPYRSLYAGGAGIAYTFWRAACLLDEPEWLHHARFWIDHVVAAPEDDPNIKPVSLEEVIRVFKENNEKIKKLIFEIVPKIPKDRNCICANALEGTRPG